MVCRNQSQSYYTHYVNKLQEGKRDRAAAGRERPADCAEFRPNSVCLDEKREEKVSNSLIFFSGGDAAAYVPLGFVDLEDLLDLLIQPGVDLRKTVLKVLMYRGFGDAEFLGCGAYRRAVFNDVNSQIAGSLFDVTLHARKSPFWSELL